MNLHSFYVALGSLVRDASATMIDVPLEKDTYNSPKAFCIRMWIFILNLTNILNSKLFFLTALAAT